MHSQKCRLSQNCKQKLYTANKDYIKTINDNLALNEYLLDQSIEDSNKQPIDRRITQQLKREEQFSIDVIGSTLLTAIQSESIQSRLSNSTIDQLIQLSQAEDTKPETRLELLQLAVASRPQGQRLVKLLEKAKAEINYQDN